MGVGGGVEKGKKSDKRKKDFAKDEKVKRRSGRDSETINGSNGRQIEWLIARRMIERRRK